MITIICKHCRIEYGYSDAVVWQTKVMLEVDKEAEGLVLELETIWSRRFSWCMNYHRAGAQIDTLLSVGLGIGKPSNHLRGEEFVLTDLRSSFYRLT
jgi:UDP-N-acetylglucosamine enolpyruvyl transferase